MISYQPSPGTPLLSPLRYPGSKRRLVEYLRGVIQVNGLRPRLYVEPFSGGASVALQLLCDGTVEEIGLADVDPLVSSFWYCVFNDTQWLIDAIDEVHVTLDEWERMKQCSAESVRQRALKCVFLNRTSFSGILAPSAGPIGGKSQTSAYSIDCRFPKSTIVKRIRQAASLRDRVRFIWGCDWRDCFRRVSDLARDEADDGIFYYLDPPFYHKAERLYSHYFQPSDHQELHDALLRLTHPWLLSYDPAQPIEELYCSNGSHPKRIETIYSAAGKSGLTRAEELIVTNLPELPGALST